MGIYIVEASPCKYEQYERAIVQASNYKEALKLAKSEFESAKVASLETQVAASSINACTLGKRKTAGGYIWKKKNDI